MKSILFRLFGIRNSESVEVGSSKFGPRLKVSFFDDDESLDLRSLFEKEFIFDSSELRSGLESELEEDDGPDNKDECVILKDPFYLITSKYKCYRCNLNQDVVTLAVSRFSGGEINTLNATELDAASRPLLIIYGIEEMPIDLLLSIREFHPRYNLFYSKTTGETHYVNICKCGANFGNFFLYQKTGGSFVPESEEAASNLSIRKLSTKGEFKFETATVFEDSAGMILNNARRL